MVLNYDMAKNIEGRSPCSFCSVFLSFLTKLSVPKMNSSSLLFLLQITSIVSVVLAVPVRAAWPWLSSLKRTRLCFTTWNRPSSRARSPPVPRSSPTTRTLSTNPEPSWPRRGARRPSSPDLLFFNFFFFLFRIYPLNETQCRFPTVFIFILHHAVYMHFSVVRSGSCRQVVLSRIPLIGTVLTSNVTNGCQMRLRRVVLYLGIFCHLNLQDYQIWCWFLLLRIHPLTQTSSALQTSVWCDCSKTDWCVSLKCRSNFWKWWN